jgi:hypothetical protein
MTFFAPRGERGTRRVSPRFARFQCRRLRVRVDIDGPGMARVAGSAEAVLLVIGGVAGGRVGVEGAAMEELGVALAAFV